MTPLFPGLGPALDSLKAREPREFPLPGEPELDPLRAILALRNAFALGGLPDEAAAARHLEAYLPVLHQMLDAFDFLPKEKVAPWTIAETEADYSRNLTLAEMLGRKSLPSATCHSRTWSGTSRRSLPRSPRGWDWC